MSLIPVIRTIKQGDDLAPGFDFSISGVDAWAANPDVFNALRPLIAEVTFEDDIEMSSQTEIKVVNTPATGPGIPVNWNQVMDCKAFQEGNYIDLHMGYGGQRIFMDRCEIVKWQPIFPAEGPITLKITGFDGRHRMSSSNKIVAKSKQEKTYYKNLPDESIVEKIASKYGYGVDYDVTEGKKSKKVLATVSQKTRTDALSGNKKGTAVKKSQKVQYVLPTRVQEESQSDWEFLQTLAAINDFDLWVDYDRIDKKYVVHFKKKEPIRLAGFVFSYNGYNGSLLSAEPDFSIKEQVTSAKVLFFDQKVGIVETVVVSDLRDADQMMLDSNKIGRGNLAAHKSMVRGASVRFTAFGQTITAISDRPFSSKADAELFALQVLKQHERDFLIVTGKVVGEATLRSRQVHELVGLSERLDGLYLFTNVKHKMSPDSIYVTEFVATKIQGTIAERNLVKKNPRGADPVRWGNRRGRWNSEDNMAKGAPGIKKMGT